MIQRQITPAQRTAALFGGIFLSVAMTAAALCVISHWRSEPSLVRTMTTIGFAGVLAFAVVLVKLARSGVFDRRRDNHLFAAIVVMMTAGLGWSLIRQALSAPDIHSLFAGAVLLMLSALSLVLHLAEQQHITTTERLNELERQLADRR